MSLGCPILLPNIHIICPLGEKKGEKNLVKDRKVAFRDGVKSTVRTTVSFHT